MPRPMLATTGTGLPAGGPWVYEPKYDGVRVIALVEGERVVLHTRSGRDTTVAFPDVVGALARLGALQDSLGARGPLLLDGEIVALEDDEPARFGAIQPRLFVTSVPEAAERARAIPAAFIAFDCLSTGGESLFDRPWTERRAALDAIIGQWLRPRRVPVALRRHLRASTVSDDGAALLAAAAERGGEGIIAKDPTATYLPGRRSAAWRKVKLETTEEFVVIGVTAESSLAARTEHRATQRGSRLSTVPAPRPLPQLPARLGALVVADLLPNGRVRPVGRVGAGLGQVASAELARRLAPLVQASPPGGVTASQTAALLTEEAPAARVARRGGAPVPVTWVAPRVVVTVRYLERTAAGQLRQPVLVGLRADIARSEVVREPAPPRPVGAAPRAVRAVRAAIDGPSPTLHVGASRSTVRPPSRREAAGLVLPGVPPEVERAIAATRAALDAAIAEEAPRATGAVANVAAHAPEMLGTGLAARAPLVDAAGWSWSVEDALGVGLTNLGKPIGEAVTKGDLLRYYVAVAPYLLRALAGRPLVLRRHTDPVAGAAFYQQHVASPTPAGVDTAVVGDSEKSRFVGGALVTLLYLAQIGAVSMDPWHGRADEPDLVDYAIIDLDPGPHTPFTRVVEVARWVHDELIALGLASVPKTSGATGMHIVVPLPSDTPAEAGRLLAELVATQVVARHAQAATIVRSVRGRASDAVYVDYLQNIAGKTVASVYSARATPTLTVSTPFTWDEVTPALDPRDWTVRSVPARLAEVGDLWGEAMLRGNDLEALRRTLFAAPTTPAGTPSAHGGSQRRRRG